MTVHMVFPSTNMFQLFGLLNCMHQALDGPISWYTHALHFLVEQNQGNLGACTHCTKKILILFGYLPSGYD